MPVFHLHADVSSLAVLVNARASRSGRVPVATILRRSTPRPISADPALAHRAVFDCASRGIGLHLPWLEQSSVL